MILDAIAENAGVQVEFYNRFQYTVEVSGRASAFVFQLSPRSVTDRRSRQRETRRLRTDSDCG